MNILLKPSAKVLAHRGERKNPQDKGYQHGLSPEHSRALLGRELFTSHLPDSQEQFGV